MTTFLKDPTAARTYGADYATNSYLAAGETISTSTWAAVPDDSSDDDGLVLSDGGISAEANLTTIKISGGKPGLVYRVVNSIVLSNSETDDRTIVVRIENQ